MIHYLSSSEEDLEELEKAFEVLNNGNCAT